jgi:hypothetical protein
MVRAAEPTLAVQLFRNAKCLFDHLVGAQQDRLRDSKAERLSGLEVHNRARARAATTPRC